MTLAYIDTAVLDAIGRVESTHNSAAVRFESGMFARESQHSNLAFNRIMQANTCSRDTACMIYCTSWGEFQILGMNLYDTLHPLYNGNIASYLVNYRAQLDSASAFLISRGITYTAKDLLAPDGVAVKHLAAVYNGPGNVNDYASRIIQALKDTGA